MVVRDDVSDDGLLVGMVHADICKTDVTRSCDRAFDREAVRPGWTFTFWVQEFGETQVLLGQVEGVLQVVVSVGLLQFVEINQVWPGKIKSVESQGDSVCKAFDLRELKMAPVFVNEGVERHSVAPAGGEVVDVDVRISVKHKGERSDVTDADTLKSFIWTVTHPAVFIWHHRSRASLAERFSLLSSVSTLMSWICCTNK